MNIPDEPESVQSPSELGNGIPEKYPSKFYTRRFNPNFKSQGSVYAQASRDNLDKSGDKISISSEDEPIQESDITEERPVRKLSMPTKVPAESERTIFYTERPRRPCRNACTQTPFISSKPHSDACIQTSFSNLTEEKTAAPVRPSRLSLSSFVVDGSTDTLNLNRDPLRGQYPSTFDSVKYRTKPMSNEDLRRKQAENSSSRHCNSNKATGIRRLAVNGRKWVRSTLNHTGRALGAFARGAGHFLTGHRFNRHSHDY